MSTRTRFAPSPTGDLHIGGVRTALFSWLHTRRHGGTFVLRIEDTDRERSTEESIAVIVDGMRWLGLEADEGPVFQTDRLERYTGVASSLIDEGKAYHCYCTREEFDAMRTEQRARGEKPRYDRRCRARTEPRPGVDPVVRFKSPLDGAVVVDDLIQGRVTYDNAELDDLVIVRSDGMPTYNFSVVVDDRDMEITDVVRGDDHLNNTPRQINIFRALGATAPRFAHVPMILGADGKRLSKRHGAGSVLDYRDRGYLPEALLNYLVRLGWSHGDQEIFSVDEMIELFRLDEVNKAASTFNPEKLDWLNQHYIKSNPVAETAERARPYLAARGLEEAEGPRVEALVDAQKERARTLVELAEKSDYFYRDFEAYEDKAAAKNLKPAAAPLLATLRGRLAELAEWEAEPIHDAIERTVAATDVKFGKLAQPVRVAVTGGAVSPAIDVTLELIGRERTLARLDRAIRYIEAKGV